jgi:uncharacterized protein (TIGR00251 family)
MALPIEERPGAVRLRVRVQPRASRTEIAGEHDGALKVRLTSPPVDGAANRELVQLLARTFRVPPSAVRLIHGETGRSKTVEITGLTAAEAARALGL